MKKTPKKPEMPQNPASLQIANEVRRNSMTIQQSKQCPIIFPCATNDEDDDKIDIRNKIKESLGKDCVKDLGKLVKQYPLDEIKKIIDKECAAQIVRSRKNPYITYPYKSLEYLQKSKLINWTNIGDFVNQYSKEYSQKNLLNIRKKIRNYIKETNKKGLVSLINDNPAIDVKEMIEIEIALSYKNKGFNHNSITFIKDDLYKKIIEQEIAKNFADIVSKIMEHVRKDEHKELEKIIKSKAAIAASLIRYGNIFGDIITEQYAEARKHTDNEMMNSKSFSLLNKKPTIISADYCYKSLLESGILASASYCITQLKQILENKINDNKIFNEFIEYISSKNWSAPDMGRIYLYIADQEIKLSLVMQNINEDFAKFLSNREGNESDEIIKNDDLKKALKITGGQKWVLGEVLDIMCDVAMKMSKTAFDILYDILNNESVKNIKNESKNKFLEMLLLRLKEDRAKSYDCGIDEKEDNEIYRSNNAHRNSIELDKDFVADSSSLLQNQSNGQYKSFSYHK